jgi:hypothetical protein
MMNRFLWISAASLVLWARLAQAQEAAAPSSELGARLLLKNDTARSMRGPAVLHSYTPDALKDPTTAANNAVAVKLVSSVSGNALRLDLSTLFGALPSWKLPDWDADFISQRGPSLTLRKGDTVVVTDLMKYGIPSLQLEVVDASIVRLRSRADYDTVYRAAGLDIQAVDESLSVFLLSVKNTSAKQISAFALSNGKASRSGSTVMDLSWLDDDRKLTPAAVYSVGYDAEMAGWRPGTKPQIVLSAVMSSDGTFDGETAFTPPMKDSRRGQKDQLVSVLDLMKAVKATTDDEVLAAIKDLKVKIAALPAEAAFEWQAGTDVTADIAYKVGKQGVRTVVLSDLADIEKTPKTYYGFGYLKKRFDTIKDRYARVQARL